MPLGEKAKTRRASTNFLAGACDLQTADALDVAAKYDESAYSEIQGIGNGPGLMGKPTILSPSQPTQNQARSIERFSGAHAWVTAPRTRGPRAPVAAGTLPGCPCSVRYPRSAKATASFASPEKKMSSKRRRACDRWRDLSRVAKVAMSPGWWHPPPDATTSASPGIQRSTAFAMLRAVSSTAVATPSAPGTRRCSVPA